MRKVFLALTVIGTVAPYAFLVPHLREHGLDPWALLAGFFGSDAAGALTMDLTVSSVVFWVWLGYERARRAWLYVLLNLTVGLSCALPLYLYVRSGEAEST